MRIRFGTINMIVVLFTLSDNYTTLSASMLPRSHPYRRETGDGGTYHAPEIEERGQVQ